jgi:hypothetical protein
LKSISIEATWKGKTYIGAVPFEHVVVLVHGLVLELELELGLEVFHYVFLTDHFYGLVIRIHPSVRARSSSVAGLREESAEGDVVAEISIA